MSPAAESVIERLDAARQKWWIVSLLSTAVLALCVSLGTLVAFALVDSLLTLPQLALGLMLVVWLLLTAAILFGVGRRLLRGQRSIEAAARRVETEFPELGSSLINIVQLSEDTKNLDQTFCQAAINQAAAQIGSIPFDQAPAKESRWRRFLYCMQTPRDLVESCGILAVLFIASVVCEMLIPNWSSAWSRLLAPWQFVPSVGSVEIVKVTPGNIDVLVGQSIEVVAQIKNPEGLPHKAMLMVTSDGEAQSPLPMTADEKYETYKLAVPSILKPLTYRLEIGDSQTQVYKVGVREKPVVESVDVTFHYPPYLARKSETFSQKGLDLEAPQYTQAELRLRMSTPVAKGHVDVDGGQYVGRVEEDGNLLVASVPLLKNGSYTVRLTDDAGHSDPDARANRISVLPDKPPTVELTKPARQCTAAPNGKVPVSIRISDDHGISRVRLEMKIQASDPEKSQGKEEKKVTDAEPATMVKQWADFKDDSLAAAVRDHTLELKPDMVKPGQTVLLRAIAWDNRVVTDSGLDLRPQETASGWCTVKIVAEETKSAAALEQVEQLRAAIWKILEKQIRARAAVGGLVKAGQPKPEGTVLSNLRTQQIEIQKTSADLAKSVGESEQKERRTIKRILNALAVGDMLQAVTRCEELLKLDSAEAMKKPGVELTAAQDRIIGTLRKILDATRQAQAEVLAEMKKRPGSDLPEEAKHKLEEMRAKLDKFLEQQKKVIEATENLAKTPVEDFTKEQEEALKGLAAAEDDWAKFMKDLHSDLSKLPEQDLANSTMAKEMVEIQVELKMAESELLKKSADIAVPIEQLGAEMAEEIKTNIEKWLYEKPDRLKWSQEEPLTDQFKEAPMAELPGELEDMIGELADQEEDLFDEMEDVTSSWTDSPDKGAGWDAMDGPISSMSAKGVTGNALPNASEIGGRSGEGRQGKSSGEFVGDEAIGKGGRKTPSRLTNDAYTKGQIKDHSKQAAGGATGGGKESGKGGEGLEGPVPRGPGQRETTRLANKQAALRNKAEAIDLQFQVSKYHHTDLKKLIDLMGQVERDLKAGRYQNALRQRQALASGLGNVKQYVEGKFEVRQDTTANLPAQIQKEILGSMQDPSPAGWEEMNRQYFERLSGAGETAASGEAEKPAKK
jgi:hypothetical protein